MIVQFCGLSGSGKTTLARAVESKLDKFVPIEVIDGDEYRETLCKGLGFAKEDRLENMRRMAFVAGKLAKHGIIPIICAINPYQEMRNEVSGTYPNVKTIYIDCQLGTLRQRDTKGLYARAELPNDHPGKLRNLTGISDPFDVPVEPELHINTSLHTIEQCTDKIGHFILQHLAPVRIIQHSSRDYYYRSVYR
jgi:adenylylsulfate kinase